MSKNFSIYLDLIRFIAAFGVFMDHLSFKSITGGLTWYIGGYGPLCVIIFFVLSGYVISYITDTREKTCRLYIVSRISRLYSVMFPALILTYFFDSLGWGANPEFYKGWMRDNYNLNGYLSSILFIIPYHNYPVFEFSGNNPGTNTPFWSLSFEFTYYVISGLFIFTPVRRFHRVVAIFTALLILIIVGKTVTVLMPIWLFGFLLYKQSNFILPRAVVACIAVFSALILYFMPNLSNLFPSDNFGFQFPLGPKPDNKNIVLDYVIAITFTAHLLAVRQFLENNWHICLPIENIIRWLGSLTFPLYCIH